MTKVGWIGIGNMGSRMSKRLLDAGYHVLVCDKIRANTEPLEKEGAEFVETPRELAEKCQYIFTMIPNARILHDIVSGDNGILKGSSADTILIDMSTIDPESSAEINTRIELGGAKFLRATVTGSTAFAEAGTLGIMVSGDSDLYEKILPMFKILGNRQVYLGDKEQSRFMKICINMMIGTTMQMLAESLVLGEKAGLDWETMINCIVDSAAVTPMIKAKADAFKQRDWSAMSTLTMMEKDMKIAMNLADVYNLSLPLTAITKSYYSAMKAGGRGNVDYSAILLINEEINSI